MFILRKQKQWMGAVLAAMVAVGSFLSGGCGGGGSDKAANAVPVKAMQALRQDTPLSFEYAGQVRGLNEVKIMPRVSGAIVEKYITGGQFVTEGQSLYKIDSRQYESAVLSARANLAKSEATLNNAMIDLRRDEALLAANAISEQTVTTQQANVKQYQALVDANRALLQKAQEDLDDTLVCAPMNGRVDVNDVAVGTYAVAGQTALMTLGSVDPVYVQFSISETEYLRLMDLHNLHAGHNMNASTVTITLSNGKEYPISGRLVQADRALSENTGTLSVKAIFENPNGMLLPGMFARVRLGGETVPNAILVPQRAVQQILDKTFVIVVGAKNQSETRAVELGEKVGSYYIIKRGINENDKIVVEGLTKLAAGMELNVTDVTPEEMGFTLNAPSSEKNASQS